MRSCEKTQKTYEFALLSMSNMTHKGTEFITWPLSEDLIDMGSVSSVYFTQLKNSVETRSDYLLYYLPKLQTVTIPQSVTRIGILPFLDCEKLKTFTFNADSCTQVEGALFGARTQITNIIFGQNVKYIPKHLCNGQTKISSVTIPNSVISIGDYAFYGCTGLTSVIIGESVKGIGDYAVSGCRSLTSITFNGTIKQWETIGKDYKWNYNVPASCIVYCSDGKLKI